MNKNFQALKKSSLGFQKQISLFLKKNKVCEKLLFITGGLLLGLILLEILLRSYYWISEKQLLGLSPARTTLKFYDNEIFGSAFVPNQAGWFVPHTREYFTWVNVNPHGWPDVEHKIPKPADTYRILILGDSFVENIQFPLEKRFFRKLEKQLNQKISQGKFNLPNQTKKIEVIALGRGNTGTAQQLLILKYFALNYQPDMVVQMFLTGNDVKNNSPTLQNDPYLPYFKINENGELEQLPHQKRSKRKLAYIKELLKKLRLTELLLSFRQKIIEGKKNRTYGYPLEYQIYQENYNQEYQEAWQITKKLILESRKLSQEKGATYLLISLTNNEQVNPGIWQRILETYSLMQKEKFDLEKPDKILDEFCREQDLNCLFMLPYFKDYISQYPWQITHNQKEGHWNETGTNLAAEFLEKNLPNYFTIK